jgi:hypothetical protein
MNIKHAKKFLGIIWIIIIGLMMGFIYGWDLDQKKTVAENSTELSDYDVPTEAPLVKTYTTEEIEDWKNEVDTKRETGYVDFQYCLNLAEYDLALVDPSLYEYVDYGESEDNTDVLAQVVYALYMQFGNDVPAYKFTSVTYDNDLMQGIYHIECEGTEYEVAISEDDTCIYVNTNIAANPSTSTEAIDPTEDIIIIEE